MRGEKSRLSLVGVGVLYLWIVLTGCSDLFGSDDDSEALHFDPPYGLTAEFQSDGSVLLSWAMDVSQSYEGFVIEKGPDDGDSFQEIDRVAKGVFSYGDNPGSGTHYYRVGALRPGQEPCYCEESAVVEIVDGDPVNTGILLEPPTWIQGAWEADDDPSFVFTFSSDNVVWEYSSTSVDFNAYNDSYADQGMYYEDNVVDADSYELLWYNAGSVQTTFRFDQIDASQLSYTDGTSTLTLIK